MQGFFEDHAVAHHDLPLGPVGDVGLVRDHDDRLPSLLRLSSISMISLLVAESRLPVGSSARMISGLLTRARAMATRCCWPPES